MNAKSAIFIVLQLSCSGLFAQALAESMDESSEKIRYKLILPDEKTPEVVKPNEPNPFNKGDGSIIKADESNSEENRVKDTLLAMRATGIVRDPDGSVRRVMLGGIPLERGMFVPSVLPDQEVALRVNSLSDTTVELFWQEKKKHQGLPPRPVIIPISIEPLVRHLLPGPSASDIQERSAIPGGRAVGRTSGRQMTGNPAPATDPSKMTARRAEPIDESGTQPPAKDPTSAPPDAQKKLDPSHPANMLMNLFMNKSEQTQKASP